VASALVAASAAFLFLVACGFVGRWKALIVALAYGLGTCVWSTSSQALWQHGPNEFFLALGTLLLTRVERGRRQAALCGLAFACAVACRPTSVLVCVAVGGYLLLARRRALLPYVLGALPVALLLAAYNWHYFESPFTFGQGIVGEKVAQYKTGSTNLWQTPIWVGAAGLIFSPSRGLLVYSPFMIFAFWGLVRVWRETKYAAFRPLTVAMLGLLGIAFCWFDWWGGWCFGYRPIVDTMPFFALLLIPMVDTILSRRWLTAVAAALLAWSIFVQVLGAWAYNLAGWNAKFTAVLRMPGKAETVAVHTEEDMRAWVQAGAEVLSAEREDIDSPDNRDRLWSLTDTQIRYNIENFWYSRDTKQDRMQQSMQKLEQ